MGDRRAFGTSGTNEIRQALFSCWPHFARVGVYSAIINVLTLSGSLYMLQVYDRVLSSSSVPTLVALTLLLLVIYGFQGFLDVLRLRMLSRIGAHFDEQIAGTVYRLFRSAAMRGGPADNVYQPVRDVDSVRAFVSTLGPTAIFDMPFMPLFFGLCFLLHPAVGAFALAGGLVIVATAVMTEFRSREVSKEVNAAALKRQTFVEGLRRNIEIVTAMGMHRNFDAVFRGHSRQLVDANLRAAGSIGEIGVFARIFRLALQSTTLGLGAYLVIKGEMSGGAMIACSILTARALSPIEIAVANWRAFVSARQGFERLEALAKQYPPPTERTLFDPPRAMLTVENISVAPPSASRAVVQGVTFALDAGDGLAIIGPSAAGKSSLIRALTGFWQPSAGEIRLDGVALRDWEPSLLGRSIGYLPQVVELFDGTIAQNISRFSPNSSSAKIIEAAQAAGTHELILSLPDAYETVIGEGGARLSGGQRQRIGLARALYGNPFLVILDEPNSSLDAAGDAALSRAISEVRQRGGIVVVATHRPSAMAGVDLLAVLVDGRLRAFGPKEKVIEAQRISSSGHSGELRAST